MTSMFALKDLPRFNQIILQCHDNPDADTMACVLALGRYFDQRRVPVRMVYGGFNRVTKPNLVAFVEAFSMPLEFVGKDPAVLAELTGFPNTLLVTVDCQHGAGNVTKIPAEHVCVIDHHIQETTGHAYERIEPYLGSCATVVWRMLKEAGFDYGGDREISTALYYGLYTDTNSLAEIFHPVDRDMLEELRFNEGLVRRLKGCNLTREELLVASKALSGATYDSATRNLLFEADPCDPNILGFISDLTLQVDSVDTCVGFCRVNGGIKLSLRSATYDTMANEFAAFLTEGVGSGGGTKEKAGGFIRMTGETEDAGAFLMDRINEYYTTYDRVVALKHRLDLSAMRQYSKKKVVVGYVRLTDIYPEGTDVNVRTLEGDAAFVVSGDTYLMIGVQGETYPIKREKFERTYETLEGVYELNPAFMGEGFYAPTIKDKLYHKAVDLMPYAKPCWSLQEASIWARPVEKSTKVFTQWYAEGYMLGKPGDYIAVRCDDENDVYIIDARIFAITYEPVQAKGGA